jgi:hypothetical protein
VAIGDQTHCRMSIPWSLVKFIIKEALPNRMSLISRCTTIDDYCKGKNVINYINLLKQIQKDMVLKGANDMMLRNKNTICLRRTFLI